MIRFKKALTVGVSAVLILSAMQVPASAKGASADKLAKFSDLRTLYGLEEDKIIEAGSYDADDIITFSFNEGAVFKGNEQLQKQILENGKNPGLGIRNLHEQGITGKGVNVAIIDQNLLLHHPEFDGKIKAYYDTGCEQPENRGSMHAPAVTSILVGDTVGVAPGASVYFAAVPMWKNDSKYFADALYWIIEQNKKLPANEKIRVVSVSAAPSGPGSFYTKNLEMWDEALKSAKKEGILVMDCRVDYETGFIVSAYLDPSDREDYRKVTLGFPDDIAAARARSKTIAVPTSYRTVAMEYIEGSPSYRYAGVGGLSWGIPYAAGVLALGWQINPSLSNDEIVAMLLNTTYITKASANIINPTAFIRAVKKTLS